MLTANTNLDDSGVNVLAEVCVKSDQSKEAEIDGFDGWIAPLFNGRGFESIPNFKEILCEKLFRERSPIKLNTFTNSTEMRGGIQPDLGNCTFIAQFFILSQDGGNEGAGGPFAFGAGNVNNIEFIEIGSLVEEAGN